jgi:hypothetical protein
MVNHFSCKMHSEMEVNQGIMGSSALLRHDAIFVIDILHLKIKISRESNTHSSSVEIDNKGAITYHNLILANFLH